MGLGLGGGTWGQGRCSWDPPSISNSHTYTQPIDSCYNLNPLFFPSWGEGDRALYSTVSLLRAGTVSVS